MLRALVLCLSALVLVVPGAAAAQEAGNDSFSNAASSPAAAPAVVRLPPVADGISPAIIPGAFPAKPLPAPAAENDNVQRGSEAELAPQENAVVPVWYQAGDPGLREAEAKGWVDVSADKWTVRLGGHVQADLVEWANKDPAITSPLARDYFEFRRLRLVADGAGYGVYDFRLQLTLEPEVTNETLGNTFPAVKDAYFSVNEIPFLGRLRIGNFFVPTSLEQVTNDTNTVFLERSVPSQGTFTFDREPGICLYNCSADQNITWSTGIFIDNISDAVQERIDNNMGYRLAGRLTWNPYYDEASNGRYMVHTGVNICYTDDHDDLARFRARPQVHEGPFLIDSGSFPAKYFTVSNFEFATVIGPFCLQSEAFLTSVDRSTDGLGKAWIYGAYAYCTYCLTGENRNFDRFGQHGAQFGRFVPRSNVFWTPGGSSWGAWELKARWSSLGENQLEAGQYNDFTFGINWYWTDRVRCLLDWIHPITTPQTVYGATKSDLIAMRFDFNW